MAPVSRSIGILLTLAVAYVYQVYLAPFFRIAEGRGRTVQPLSDFPGYSCRRVEHPLLEGCEDLWLDRAGRVLLAACADPETRTAYQPTVNRRDAYRRTKNDRFVALRIDHPGPKRDYQPVKLETAGYSGAQGDASLDLHGFDVETAPAGAAKDVAHVYAINHRPPVKPDGSLLDAGYHGCNSTVEVFEYPRGATQLKWLRTVFAPDAVKTPNRVALLQDGKGSFVATNDHGTKVSPWRLLEQFHGQGSLAYCAGARKADACTIATPERLCGPNGVVRNHVDGLFYVPSSNYGTVEVYRLEGGSLKLLHAVKVDMPIDNLTVDRDGVVWAAAFPTRPALVAGFENPRTAKSPAAVWRIERLPDTEKGGLRYKHEKVLEDRDAEQLPGATTVVHDAETGRLFLGGVWSPYISVCEAK